MIYAHSEGESDLVRKCPAGHSYSSPAAKLYNWYPSLLASCVVHSMAVAAGEWCRRVKRLLVVVVVEVVAGCMDLQAESFVMKCFPEDYTTRTTKSRLLGPDI